MTTEKWCNGWYQKARHCPSPHVNARPANEVSLLVIHNISLPAGEFGTPYIEQLFMGTLDESQHPSFIDLVGLKVSAHFLIRRDGELIQFVSVNDRAWHAGVSLFLGRDSCNDFSVGIELEGTDLLPYEDIQYHQLKVLTNSLMQHYPSIIPSRIVGHNDIAPGRKTDPGEAFDWQRYLQSLS